MSVRSVQISSIENKRYNAQKKNNNHNSNNVSFGNAAVTLMDAIDRGGFAASFILQDFLGMAGPRVITGMYRNHDKTGELNWDFAKKEGIREFLSGPSAFLIPAGMMYGIKKISGSANNIPVNFINGFGESFAKFASENKALLADPAKAKAGYYEEVFRNVLSTSTNGGLSGEELSKSAKNFAQRLVEAEKAPSKGFWNNLVGKHVAGSAQDLQQEIVDDIVKFRKQFLGANGDKLTAEYALSDGKKIGTSVKSLFGHMKDYTEDAVKTAGKKLNSVQDLNVEEFVKTFGKRRTGTRFLSNMGMWLAVVGFYTIIPKLYNKATNGRDPGLDGLDIVQPEEQQQNSKDPAFKGNKGDVAFTGAMGGVQKAMAGLGDAVVNNKALNKISSLNEFSGASMSMPAMLALLFGFCLPPRLVHAQSNTDRKEILFRDFTSFSAILFGAKTITRVLSDVFAKKTGLALNVKPQDHKDSIFKRAWHYIYPSGGVQVLDDGSIKANYSKVDSFKNGLLDMFKFTKDNGGNVGKMLTIDKNIKEAATEILGEVPNKNMKYSDIADKFKAAKGSEAYEKIVKALSDSNNSLVKAAKKYNSLFGFVSTIFLVPALMIWISKHCENMTKKRIEEQKAASMKDMTKQIGIPEPMQVVTNRPTMAGFLNKK